MVPGELGGSLSKRLENRELLEEVYKELIPQEILNLSFPIPAFKITSIHLRIRMLFSCLVDADFLDTEQFMNPVQNDNRQVYETLESLKIRFEERMKSMDSIPDTLVNRTRKKILDQCRQKAVFPQGIFSLTCQQVVVKPFRVWLLLSNML